MEIENGVKMRNHIKIILPAVFPQELGGHLATLHLPLQLLGNVHHSQLAGVNHHLEDGEVGAKCYSNIHLKTKQNVPFCGSIDLSLCSFKYCFFLPASPPN